MGAHPPLEQIFEAVRRSDDSAMGRDVQRHLAECEFCRDWAAWVAEVLAAIAVGHLPQPSESDIARAIEHADHRSA